eukprot:GAHX01005011.1.p1 GENE.GAHX01005011.1~~GAHX01005011.1.p1  ORF type:complete len:57 (-),score=0.57 GAHX01005011.1:6-176(-)
MTPQKMETWQHIAVIMSILTEKQLFCSFAEQTEHIALNVVSIYMSNCQWTHFLCTE